VKPDPTRFLAVAAGHLLTHTAGALGPGYEQSSVSVMGLVLTAVAEEFERAAARRVAENRELRRIFAAAEEVVASGELREKLVDAARGEDTSLSVSDLERANAELRGLLIELHAHVEELDSEPSRALEQEIWRELVASTERRKLAIGTF
jgi:hypothetical protein